MKLSEEEKKKEGYCGSAEHMEDQQFNTRSNEEERLQVTEHGEESVLYNQNNQISDVK